VFLEETQRLLGERSPGAVVATWCDVLDVDVLVSVHVDSDERLGTLDDILAAADDDPSAASRRWVDIVTGTAHATGA